MKQTEWHPEGQPCGCGCTEASCLPIKPSKRAETRRVYSADEMGTPYNIALNRRS